MNRFFLWVCSLSKVLSVAIVNMHVPCDVFSMFHCVMGTICINSSSSVNRSYSTVEICNYIVYMYMFMSYNYTQFSEAKAFWGFFIRQIG